jgi:hypothetical protein
MNLRATLRTFGLAAIALVATAAVMVAAAPSKPVEFSAKRVTEPNKPLSVLLSWLEAGDGDAATHFDIYIADGETENADDFRLLATVDAVERKDGKNRHLYKYSAEDLAEGVYTFYVVARNDDGTSQRTPFKVVHVERPQAKLTFVSAPAKTATSGVAYRYQAKATSNQGGTVRYSLVDGPDGMEINEETGVIEWVPTEEGRYEIVIKATVTLDNGETLEQTQSFAIEVKTKRDDPKDPNDPKDPKDPKDPNDPKDPKDDKCAKVTGSIKSDPASNAGARGVVTAWRIDLQDDASGNDRAELVFKAPFDGGRYFMYVPAGTYKFHIEGDGFEAQWYSNATTADDATAKTLTCNTILEIHFTVAALPMPDALTVSGTVTDQETGEPLRAVVAFEVTSKRDGRAIRVARAETREDGSYSVQLSEGMSYIAFAKPVGKHARQYGVEFFEETADHTTATPVAVDGNRSNVNFTLAKLPEYANSLSGFLKNTDGAAVTGKVSLYMLADAHGKDKNDDVPVHKKFVYSVETTEDGTFLFSNLVPGKYVMFGQPNARPTTPGWYIKDGTASKEWKDGTVIAVEEVMPAVMFDFVLGVGEKELRGQGTVRGFVLHNKVQGVNNSGDATQGLVTVHGALVMALDSRGAVVDWTLSDLHGGYTLSNLPVASVTIFADRIGMRSATNVITVDGMSRANQDVTMALSDVTSSVETPTVLSENGFNLWPNPASASATVQFVSSATTATIVVTSTDGTVVSTMQPETVEGLTRVVVPTVSLPSGRYLVRITTGTRHYALPLAVVR